MKPTTLTKALAVAAVVLLAAKLVPVRIRELNLHLSAVDWMVFAAVAMVGLLLLTQTFEHKDKR